MGLMDKVNLMVKLKERIYELRYDASKKDEIERLQRLLKRISSNPDVKYV